jgi:hypothetical protein
MNYWNLGKWASVLASCVVAVLCGASLVGVDNLQASPNIPAPTGKVVILQADGAAPPPPPPSIPKPVGAIS